MKIAVLTTLTLHHLYFLREINAQFGVSAVFLESSGVKASFDTFHPFEEERESYERDLWFKTGMPQMREFCEVLYECNSVNDAKSEALIHDIAPDVTIVFGTGKISVSFIEKCPGILLNLHGGDPRKFRGLDTHLWAIYHNEFKELVTSLHFVVPRLDAGNIIAVSELPIRQGMQMHQLRELSTGVCVSLVLAALQEYELTGAIKMFTQKELGRYYSFMPAVLKDVCVKKFHKFTGYRV